MSAADQTCEDRRARAAAKLPPPVISWRRRWVNYLVFIPLVALGDGLLRDDFAGVRGLG